MKFKIIYRVEREFEKDSLEEGIDFFRCVQDESGEYLYGGSGGAEKIAVQLIDPIDTLIEKDMKDLADQTIEHLQRKLNKVSQDLRDAQQIIRDDTECEEECRKLLSNYDTSNSNGVVPLQDLIQKVLDEFTEHVYTDEDLFDADPNCKHKVICAPGGGVKCTKCSGWFCY